MDRITRVRIRNVRAIERIDLEVSRPLTVLIGENGAGKSTIIECLELLRKAADPGFMQQFYNLHRGMPGLLRKGTSALELGVVVEDDAGMLPRIEYAFTLAAQRAGAVVQGERMLVGPTESEHANLLPDPELARVKAEVDEIRRKTRRGKGMQMKQARQQLPEAERKLAETEAASQQRAHEPLMLLRREEIVGVMFDRAKGEMVPLAADLVKPDQLTVTSFGNLPPNKAIERLLAVLRGIETHLGFETLAAWAARSLQRPVSVRAASTLFPAERLNLLGINLANAWSDLRGRDTAHWDRTMALVRLGLGERVDSVTVTPDMGGGNVYLALRFTDLAEPILASDLSDGQLAWLAFVAMARLNERRSLLAVDEPELHLHPALLGRVVSLLSGLDGGAPVILSTHSDRVLELLDDPAGAVRVCSLEGNRAVISRLDTAELPRWLEQFGDLGQLRASGYLPRVLAAPSSNAAKLNGGGE